MRSKFDYDFILGLAILIFVRVPNSFNFHFVPALLTISGSNDDNSTNEAWIVGVVLSGSRLC
jgi:hypothetical protein